MCVNFDGCTDNIIFLQTAGSPCFGGLLLLKNQVNILNDDDDIVN